MSCLARFTLPTGVFRFRPFVFHNCHCSSSSYSNSIICTSLPSYMSICSVSKLVLLSYSLESVAAKLNVRPLNFQPKASLFTRRSVVCKHVYERKKKKEKKGSATEGMEIDVEDKLGELGSDLNESLEKLKEFFMNQLAGIQTGKATPNILDSVKVDGQPLRSYAQVSVKHAQLLLVNVYSLEMVGKVQKAIQAANLGLNPQNTRGQLFEIPIPKMTQETRETLKKLSRDYLEKAKQSMRNHRRTAFDGMKQLIQQKAITKDESRRYEKDFQKVIDDFSKELESMCSAKEKELDRH